MAIISNGQWFYAPNEIPLLQQKEYDAQTAKELARIQAGATTDSAKIQQQIAERQVQEAAAQRAQENNQFGQRFNAQQSQVALFQQLLGLAPAGGLMAGGIGGPSGSAAPPALLNPSAGGQPGYGPGGYGSPLLGNSPLYQENLADVQNMGAGQLSRINTDFTNAGNSAVANLNARGLGASSLVGGALNSAADHRNQAELDLQDQMLGRRTAVRDTEADRQNALRGQLLGQLGNFNYL